MRKQAENLPSQDSCTEPWSQIAQPMLEAAMTLLNSALSFP